MIVDPSPSSLARATELLRRDALVAFPTETVYGLGACATSEEGIAKIYRAKGRPATNPLIVHVATIGSLAGYVAPSPREEHRLARLESLWPGPLTVVFESSRGLAANVSSGLASVAIRIPAHPIAQQLLQLVGLPLAAPSANRSNYVSPTTAQHVYDEFGDDIPLIIDGGPCAVGIESTIISIGSSQVRLLRPGIITVEELEGRLGEKLEVTRGEETRPISPGQLATHYAPRTPLVFFDETNVSDIPVRSGLLTLKPHPSKEISERFQEVCALSEHGDLLHVARRLFAALRELDKKQLELIVVERCGSSGVGLAILDRLVRATTKSPTTE